MSRDYTDLNEVSDLDTSCHHDLAFRVIKSCKVVIEGVEQTDTSSAICAKFDGRGVDVSTLWAGVILWARHLDEVGAKLSDGNHCR